MPKRTDANQKKIMDQLRQIPGVSVRSLHTVGKGMSDIVVGYRKQNFLFEIKDPSQRPSDRKLTPDEEKFFAEWTGQVAKIETFEDALRVLNGKE